MQGEQQFASQFANIHTHTNFCDGTDDIETYCLAAHEKGLSSLGFSAHSPVTRKTGILSIWNMADDKLEEYLEAVQKAKKRWEGKLKVYLGLEIDYVQGMMGPADKEYMDMDLDFIIGAVHYVIPPKGAPITIDGAAELVERGIREGFDGDHMGMVEMYMNLQEAMIKEGGFDVLAHPDVLKKNNIGPDGRTDRIFSEDNEFYLKRTEVLAKLMGKKDKGKTRVIEVNTGGLNREKTRDCYPSLPFLKLFRQQGVGAVINSDAHNAEHLIGHYEEACKQMLAAGYEETVLFEGREGGNALWRGVRL